MFSSNQVLQISGHLFPSVIKDALDYALKAYGGFQSPVGWQITKDNKFCIGLIRDGNDWQEFPIDFDTEMAAPMIYKFLDRQQYNLDGPCDGAYEKGFLMKSIGPSFNSDNPIKSSCDGIVSFETFVNFYAK